MPPPKKSYRSIYREHTPPEPVTEFSSKVPEGIKNCIITVVIGVFLMVVIGALIPSPPDKVSVSFPDTGTQSQTNSDSSNTLAFASESSANASMHIRAGNSAARNQYTTEYQWQVWSLSSCSGFAFMEVLNSYGDYDQAHIVSDVLSNEQQLGSWDETVGIYVGDSYYTRIAEHYGFNSNASSVRSIDDVIRIARSGYPVIVGIRGTYEDTMNGTTHSFPHGHILVVKSGDSNTVSLVDSSLDHMTQMYKSDFAKFFNKGGHFSFVMWPKNIPAPRL